MNSITRTLELRAGQENVVLPEGLFMIDRRERPLQNGWYDIEYDPFDQFISIVGVSVEATGERAAMVAENIEVRSNGH